MTKTELILEQLLKESDEMDMYAKEIDMKNQEVAQDSEEPETEEEMERRRTIEADPNSGKTQVATTTATYKLVAKLIKSRQGSNVDVLDYGAGRGLGSEAMREEGLDVESLEPNPTGWSPDYTNSNQIPKGQKYDAIVSLSVINVLPKNIRTMVISDIFDLLERGGSAYITARASIATKEENKEPFEDGFMVKNKGGRNFQKPFSVAELKQEFINVLEDDAFEYEVDFEIERMPSVEVDDKKKKINGSGIIITKL